MQAAEILQELRRQRLFVALAAGAALLVWLIGTYSVSLPPRSRQHDVGIATAQILVDTPRSQVVNVASAGSETLVARASLLAHLMTEGDLKAAIARRAGLQPEDVVGVVEGAVQSPAEASNTKAGRGVSVLTTRLVSEPSGALPIVEIEAEAPDTARALRLATAAVAGLHAYLKSKAVIEDVSDKRRLRVSGLGAAQAGPVVRGPRSVITLGAALFVFLSGCALILLAPTLARAWRAASEVDQSADVAQHQALGPLNEGHLEPMPTNGSEAPVAARRPPDNGDASAAHEERRGAS